MIDRRDRNPYKGAEFPVPVIVNPRMAAFTLPVLSTTEARNQHREMLRRLGAARDALWIAELSNSMAELNRRAIWGTMNQPGQPATRPQMIRWQTVPPLINVEAVLDNALPNGARQSKRLIALLSNRGTSWKGVLPH
jgi:hypothetical protein